MGYIQDAERELRDRLMREPDDTRNSQAWQGWADGIMRFVKDKLWESYRNGTKAAQHGNTSAPAAPKPRTFSRRR